METWIKPDGPFIVTWVANNIISMTGVIKVKPLNITQVLPITPERNDLDLKDDTTEMEKYSTYFSNNIIWQQFSVEIRQNIDPQYTCKASLDAIEL